MEIVYSEGEYMGGAMHVGGYKAMTVLRKVAWEGQSQRDTCRHQKPIIARHVSTSKANHNTTRVNVKMKLETLFYK
uniref:Uncharacterized protein n=1 Tax=Malus domestica TaxID=3750 RepID=E4Z8M4_MALDO|nr:hypothetical protein [Malus domestica]